MNIEHITLVRTPEGVPLESDFAPGYGSLGALAGGEALVRVHALSLDPYLRSAMSGRHLSAAIQPGDVVRGEGWVEVLESRHPRMAVGTHWVAACGWRSAALLDRAAIDAARPIASAIEPRTLALGGLGMPGLTAWAGFYRMCEAKTSETLVVSAASGAVGATVGQLARIAGCRVLGIAGGPEKCAWVQNVAKFDACIDYRQRDLRSVLRELAPNGVDIYFDNVGGDVLQAVSEQLALRARVVLCGLMANYNGPPAPGPNPGLWIKARATVRGLVVYDHWAHFDTMVQELLSHHRADRLHFREELHQGLHAAPAAFCRLMRGENQGKVVVRL